MPSGPKGRSSGPSPRTCAQLPLRSARLPRLTSAARSQLKEAGYHTSYSGKYLNQYALPGSPGCAKSGDPGCGKHIPKGWDDWHGLHGNSRYYNGTISDNGVNSFHGTEPEDYLPDVFFGHAKAFVAAHLENEAKAGTPFLCVLATPSCHGPFTPAPKYVGHFGASLCRPRLRLQLLFRSHARICCAQMVSTRRSRRTTTTRTRTSSGSCGTSARSRPAWRRESTISTTTAGRLSSPSMTTSVRSTKSFVG